MKWLLAGWLFALLSAAGLALADAPPERTPAERLQEFRRQLALVRNLVKGGLRLSKEDDPLKRADQCHDLARGLTQELQRAVKGRDRRRADLLGQRLEALLVRGIAGNLELARDRLPANSPSLPRLHDLGEKALALMEPLQAELNRVADHDQMPAVQQAVTQGRAELERAVRRAKGSSSLKAPPVGTKLKK